MPVLLLGIAIALALCGYVACARISGDNLSAQVNGHVRARMFDVSCAFAGSLLCVIAMEGYETRFGGLSPFDAQSVVLSHAPVLLVTFAIAAIVVRNAVREMLFAAERAGERAVDALVRFVSRLLRLKLDLPASHASQHRFSAFRLPTTLVAVNCGLRAPPAGTTLRLLVI